MKLKIYQLTRVFLSLILILLIPFFSLGSEYKARISVDYYNEVGSQSYLRVNVKYKKDKTYFPASGLEVNIYKADINDSLDLMGKLVIDPEGYGDFPIDIEALPKADTALTYEYVIRIENNDLFKDAEKKVDFKLAKLEAEIIDADTAYVVKVRMSDILDEPLKKEKIKLMVDRLFAPLELGDEKFKTDRKGMIEVPIMDPPPSNDGNLTFIIHADSRDYGINILKISAPIGAKAQDLSTFDQRTMWSPANKTPLVLLLLSNMVIFGIWVVIAIIVFNLIKIYKS